MKQEEKQLLKDGVQEIGLDLSPEQMEKLSDYLDLLLKWNKVFNLTSITTEREGVHKHLLDCLSLIPYLKKKKKPEFSTVADVGSGGGLPAAVIAICLPDMVVHSIDAVGKKSLFVTQAASQLGLSNLKAKHCRIENSGMVYDMVVCRAFSSLKTFAELTSQCVREDGIWIAMKGKLPLDEIKELPPAFQVKDLVQVNVPGLEEERTFVEFQRQVVKQLIVK